MRPDRDRGVRTHDGIDEREASSRRIGGRIAEHARQIGLAAYITIEAHGRADEAEAWRRRGLKYEGVSQVDFERLANNAADRSAARLLGIAVVVDALSVDRPAAERQTVEAETGDFAAHYVDTAIENAWRDFLDSPRSNQKALSQLGGEEHPFEATLAYDREAAAAVHEYEWRLVQEVLPRLSARQREILDWRFAQGLRSKEIARRLNTSEDNARHLVHRAIERLRKLLPAREAFGFCGRLDAS